MKSDVLDEFYKSEDLITCQNNANNHLPPLLIELVNNKEKFVK
ncbi:MAG: hypothetical protein U5K55_01460 [Aliarcobacter sp.]|nr:hypothetical protein [Aliarcobacter sp.]